MSDDDRFERVSSLGEGGTGEVFLDRETGRELAVKVLKEWIANARRLDALLEELQEVSFRITERLLPPKPARRAGKRGSDAVLG